MQRKFYSGAELARRLNVTNSTINSHIRSGEIKPTLVSPSNRFKFSEEDLNALIEEWGLKDTEYTVDDVVAKYKISKPHLYTINKRGVFKSRRLLNGIIVFNKAEVDKYFAKNSRLED